MPLEGTNLGSYHLLRLLGKGGMAEVYLAYDEALDREVAVKVVGGTRADYLERFWREVEAVDKLAHDHILPAYDYDDDGPWHYMVMLYVPHGTLRDRLENGPLTPEEAGEMLEQIAEALQFAHDHGIIHRDIKPSNILLRDNHYAYLADFGLAKSLEGSHQLTQTGALLGTPEYMAPDLSEGPATTSSDIYALGVVLYQMLTGQVPFSAETPLAVYWKQIREQPRPPSHHNVHLTPAIDALLMRALEKNPRHRFQSARELADAYKMALRDPERYLAEESQHASRSEPTSPAQPSIPYRTFKSAARSKRITGKPRRVIFPGDPLVAPTAVSTSEKRTPPITRPSDADHFRRGSSASPETPYPDQQFVYQPERRQRKLRRRMSLVVGIIAVGLLVFVALPMAYIYYIFATTPKTATSTSTVVQQTTATPQSQATVSNAGKAPIPAGTPVLADSLTGNVADRWKVDTTHCIFSGGSYHVVASQIAYPQPCPLLASPMSNTAVQVDVSLLSGTNVGMLLRLQGERFYDFEINNKGQFFFRRHDVGGGSYYIPLILPTTSRAILAGSQKNTLLVIANGDDFKLYINGTFVGETRDSQYASGQFALTTESQVPMVKGEGSFTNFKMFNVA